ncbi:enoyl-CoA hydratase/isomerase family protein [Nitriliruptoraceae bacterium ZYF776]|nr:enoyl-CoA hydratase/isomerase family protein [Profundirhabdus halotolerans]
MARHGDVLIERGPGVVRATFDRPDERNAINEGLIEGMAAAIDIATRQEARVLVLRGAGGTFCAGADLQYVSSLLAADDRGLEEYIGRLADVLARFEAAPFAVLAAIEGYALAGGCEILLACDMALATTDARIGDRHLEYGLLPGAGGSVRLPRTLPIARARYLLMTGEMIDGTTAADWGLVTRAVPPGQFDEALEQLVGRLASRSVDALAAVKRMTLENAERDVPAGVEAERRIFSAYFRDSADGREGLAAFREKRVPQFRSPVRDDQEATT